MGRVTAFIIAAAVCATIGGVAKAESWRCLPQREKVCSESGCAAITPGIWLIIDFNAKTLSRCDDSGCEVYPMTVVASGAFINVTYQPGVLLKAVSDGSAYLEVATLGLTTYVYFGRCQQD